MAKEGYFMASGRTSSRHGARVAAAAMTLCALLAAACGPTSTPVDPPSTVAVPGAPAGPADEPSVDGGDEPLRGEADGRKSHLPLEEVDVPDDDDDFRARPASPAPDSLDSLRGDSPHTFAGVPWPPRAEPLSKSSSAICGRRTTRTNVWLLPSTSRAR